MCELQKESMVELTKFGEQWIKFGQRRE